MISVIESGSTNEPGWIIVTNYSHGDGPMFDQCWAGERWVSPVVFAKTFTNRQEADRYLDANLDRMLDMLT